MVKDVQKDNQSPQNLILAKVRLFLSSTSAAVLNEDACVFWSSVKSPPRPTALSISYLFLSYPSEKVNTRNIMAETADYDVY